MLPEPIKKFINVFSKLPSIGPRMATRLAFFLSGLDKNALKELEDAFAGLKKVSRCPNCFFIKSGSHLCSICADPRRDKGTIAIVEKDTDLMSLEKTRAFGGHYLVLGELAEAGSLTPNEKLRLQHLKERIRKNLDGKAKEILVAFSPSSIGDFTAELVKREFNGLAEKITRLGRGIPTGGEIEFADEETLRSALERRN
ncbi:MAG TPA: toprim domain-containing protein [Candidatus Paceibacterota bacterium]|nr:toprim domain-containing protein [Candidatus Paceibacterota bacterium]